jgi:membrane associated rhomboid family serine protease
MSFVDDIKHQFSSSNSLIKLLYINAGVFLITIILTLIGFLINKPVFHLTEWFAVPASLSELIYKPWTVLTYMFLHEGLWHILFNMLMLYFTGIIFNQYLGENKITGVYILSGLSGALLYLIAYNVFPVFALEKEVAVCLGASASVIGILVATATYVPNLEVRLFGILPVKLKWIAIVLILLDFINLPKDGNAGGHIAHLGGAIFGFLFVTQYRKGNDISKGFSNFLEKLKNLFSFKKKSKLKVKYTGSTKTTSAKEANQQAKVDAILDKISKSGYDSLSKDEKEFLFNINKNS